MRRVTGTGAFADGCSLFFFFFGVSCQGRNVGRL